MATPARNPADRCARFISDWNRVCAAIYSLVSDSDRQCDVHWVNGRFAGRKLTLSATGPDDRFWPV